MVNKIYFKRSACCTVFCALEKAAPSCTAFGWGGVVDGKTGGPQVDHISAHLGHKGHRLLPISEKGSRGHKTEVFLVACSRLKRFGDSKHILELLQAYFEAYFKVILLFNVSEGRALGVTELRLQFPVKHARRLFLCSCSALQVGRVSPLMLEKNTDFRMSSD